MVPIQSKVFAALVGIAGSFQNGSAIPVSWRCLLPQIKTRMATDSEDSRMCDPFCNDPEIPSKAAITLIQRIPDARSMAIRVFLKLG